MENHFVVRTLEWASKKVDGFTYDELHQAIEFSGWERTVIDQHFQHALTNRDLRRTLKSTSITETMFYMIKGGSSYKDETSVFVLKFDALFRYVEYEELKFARETAAGAKRLSTFAIMVSVLAIIVPLLVTLFLRQHILIDSGQLNNIIQTIESTKTSPQQ